MYFSCSFVKMGDLIQICVIIKKEFNRQVNFDVRKVGQIIGAMIQSGGGDKTQCQCGKPDWIWREWQVSGQVHGSRWWKRQAGLIVGVWGKFWSVACSFSQRSKVINRRMCLWKKYLQLKEKGEDMTWTLGKLRELMAEGVKIWLWATLQIGLIFIIMTIK